MPSIIDAFLIEVGLDAKQFNRQQQDVTEKWRKTADAMERDSRRVESAANKATEALAAVGRQVLGLYALLLGARGITEFVTQITTADAALGRLGTNLGMTPQRLFAWQMAVKEMGGSAEGFTGALTKATDALYKFHTLGQDLPLDVWTLFGKAGGRPDTEHGPAAYLNSIADALQRLAKIDPVQAAAAGRAVIGDEATVNLMIKHGAALEKYLAARERLAPSQEDIRRAQELQQAWVNLEGNLRSLTRILVEQFLPKLTEAAGEFDKWSQSQTGKDFIRDFATNIKDAAAGLGTIVSNLKEVYGWLDKLNKKMPTHKQLDGDAPWWWPLPFGFGYPGNQNKPDQNNLNGGLYAPMGYGGGSSGGGFTNASYSPGLGGMRGYAGATDPTGGSVFGGGGGARAASLGGGSNGGGGGGSSGFAPPADTGAGTGTGIDRERWRRQLMENPALLERLYRHSLGENTHPLANQAIMEEAANRADIRGVKNFADKGNLSYFQGYYRGTITAKMRKMLDDNFRKVFVEGSDVSNGAIDNSSGWLAAKHDRTGRFRATFRDGGETFQIPGTGESGAGERARYPAFRQRQLDQIRRGSIFDTGGGRVPYLGDTGAAASARQMWPVPGKSSSIETNINSLTVNTQGTDANAIARDMQDAITRYSTTDDANYGYR